MRLPSRAVILELWRFYQAAVVNTVFGFGLYAILITLGMDIFLAQAVSFVCGVAFNYVVYSKHVFPTAQAAKIRFAIAYVVNYGMNLGFLWVLTRVTSNGYIAGFGASLIASLINYFALKFAVFSRTGAQ